MAALAPVSGLTRRVIPCLDVRDGRVTKGVQFADNRDVGDPVALAAYYDQSGADEMTFYDITASSDGRETMVDVVRATARQVFIPLTVGGGVRTTDDIARLLRAGADKVSVNSGAVANPALIAEGAKRFGRQCIVLSIDARRRAPNSEGGDGWEVTTHGNRRATALDAVAWAVRGVELGAGEIVLNSIDADGTRAGYDLALTAAVAALVNVPVIASGGAGRVEDFAAAFVAGHAHAVLAAGILHDGTVTIAQIKDYLATQDIPVRPLEAE